jgi:hypothetical protein
MAGRAGWRTRWKVTRELSGGRPIPVDQRATARAVISSFRRHPELRWIWVLLGLVWLFIASLAAKDLRWAYLAVGLVTLASGLHQAWMRRRILGREDEMALPDSHPT